MPAYPVALSNSGNVLTGRLDYVITSKPSMTNNSFLLNTTLCSFNEEADSYLW